MKKNIIRFFFLLFIINIFLNNYSISQSRFFSNAEKPSKKRMWIASGLASYVEIGSLTALYQVWYAQNSNSSFHFFDDFGNWGNVDKYGHSYSAYQFSRTCTELYKWTGMSQKKSAVIGSSIGLGYQTTLEIFDGFSSGYGFSWGDVLFNLLGTGIFLGQELTLKQQLCLPKFSYLPTTYASIRPSALGSNHAQRLLKDYNGQTYWLSFSPSIFSKNNQFPKWLCVSIGYGIDGRIVGDQTNYTDQNGISYYSKAEYYLSLDLDLKKIPVKNKTIKKILSSLNYLKIPAPAISIRGKQLKIYPIYF